MIVISLAPIAFSSDFVAQYLISGVLLGFYKSCPKLIHNLIKSQGFFIVNNYKDSDDLYYEKIYLDETRTKMINAYS